MEYRCPIDNALILTVSNGNVNLCGNATMKGSINDPNGYYCSAHDTKLTSIIKIENIVPFYRYYNGSDHFYTINAQEIGTIIPGSKGHHNYISEGICCQLYNTKVEGTIELYRYSNGKEHFYTTNSDEIGTVAPGSKGKHNYVSEGVSGYVYPTIHKDTKPLYRYLNGSEHFYTINAEEVKGNPNCRFEGIACYVF